MPEWSKQSPVRGLSNQFGQANTLNYREFVDGGLHYQKYIAWGSMPVLDIGDHRNERIDKTLRKIKLFRDGAGTFSDLKGEE